MLFITRKSIVASVVIVIVVLAALAGFLWSGIYNIGADDAHSKPVHAMLQMLRERSIAVRAAAVSVPDLDDPERIRRGAGNYDAMCVGCHLAPGMAATELSAGLYPAPPNLSQAHIDAAEAFWVVKHGIKASGMPAWGKRMGDAYLWDLIAFVQQLPTLDAAGYRALVASSGGHSHGGGESMAHGDEDHGGDHHEGADEHSAMPGGDEPQGHTHGDSAASDHATAGETATVTHRHADGTVESHPAPAEHDHDHEHNH